MDKNTKDTIIAFIRTAAALAAVIAAAFGVDIDADMIENAVMLAAAFCVVAWGCWKDNNFTKAASEAHEFVQLFKNTEPRCDMEVEDDDYDEDDEAEY